MTITRRKWTRVYDYNDSSDENEPSRNFLTMTEENLISFVILLEVGYTMMITIKIVKCKIIAVVILYLIISAIRPETDYTAARLVTCLKSRHNSNMSRLTLL